MTAYQQLEKKFARLSSLDHALTLMHWDKDVMMPEGGAPARADAMAELAGLHHHFLTEPGLSDLLRAASESSNLNPEQQANLQEMTTAWQDANGLPEQLVRAMTIANSRCEQGWRNQRKDNDWTGFTQNFSEVVALAREQAAIRQKQNHVATPYDGLLSLYCKGDSSGLISNVFDALKAELPELIQTVVAQQGPDYAPDLSGSYTTVQQKKLSQAVMGKIGFDFNRGRLDESSHPFSTGFPGDQRITTRYNKTHFIEALYGTIHETGHASYEAGLPSTWASQPVGRSGNMCIHESQSLFFENQVGASKAFCEFLAPMINTTLQPVAKLDANDLYRNVTRVQPGFIRVSADELTYPLHIILRYEIESALINGDIEVKHLPDLWAEKMHNYLGLDTKGNYCDGVLQDVHWPSGAFGYFPAYTLGAVNAAQLFQAMKKDISNAEASIAQGEFSEIKNWLAKHVWSRARFVDSQTIMRDATGEPTNAEALLAHFKRRYL